MLILFLMHFVFIQMQGVKGIRCIINVEDDSVETSVKSFTNNVKAWSKIKLAANY